MSHVGGSAGAGTSRAGAYRSLALLLVLAAVIAWVAPAAVIQETIEALLLADTAVPGWSRDGGLRKYAGEDLYTYIDGGAEIYQEYGFRRVVVQDYKNAAGKSVSLEIFEMETPAAAYGMFTFKRSGKGKSVPLGGGGALEDYYLNFWKGRYLMTLTGFDEAPETIDGLRKLAGVVDAKTTGDKGIPGLVGILPQEGLRPESVKYLRGILGLNNIYDFHTTRGLNFSEAVKGDYGDGSSLIVLRYDNFGTFEASFIELWAYLEKSERFKRVGPDSSGLVLSFARMVFQDGKGRFVSFAAQPFTIFVGMGADADNACKRMVSAMWRTGVYPRPGLRTYFSY